MVALFHHLKPFPTLLRVSGPDVQRQSAVKSMTESAEGTNEDERTI